MSPGAGNAVYPVTLNSDTMPRDVLIAIRQRRRHDLPSRVSVCCLPIQWDDAYEFTAPKPRQWWRRLMLYLGCASNDYGGTMFDVIDGLYEEGKINRTQMGQLEALVRVAMGCQYKAEQDIGKHIILGMVAAICGAVVPVVVGIQTTMQDQQMAHYLSYFAIILSLVQTVCVTLSQVGNYSQSAMSRRMTAAEIKAEIYKFEALAGEYSDPQSHDAQFGKLMFHLAEFRQKAVEVQYAARSGGGDKKGDENKERKKADTEMKASGNRGV